MKLKAVRVVPAAVLVLFFTTAALWAHHSFTAQYDSDKVIALRGTIVNVQWMNPHVLVEIQGFDAKGERSVWMLEGGSPNEVSANSAALGRGPQPLRAGEVITICGYLANTVDSAGYMRVAAESVMLPDGGMFLFAVNGPKTCMPADAAISQAPANRRGRRGAPSARADLAPFEQDAVILPAAGYVNSTLRPFEPSPAELAMPKEIAPEAGRPPRRGGSPIPSDPVESAHLELYDRNREVRLTGTVLRVEWTNPNSYIYLSAGGDFWALESSFIQFRQSNVSPAIREGDVISVFGFLPKDNPSSPLPARGNPTAAPFLKENHLIRASEITSAYGQRLSLGEPPAHDDLSIRARCSTLGC